MRQQSTQAAAEPVPRVITDTPLYPPQLTDSAKQQQERFLDKADEAQRLTQTFQKFVPRQFVDHFAKHGSSSLELGRADEDDVAILFCDIRGFTGLSERMKPHELMKFLNSYFLRMNDPIHQNGGFIDKFIGDAIMALFDHPDGHAADKANDALNAAIDLHRALAIYNKHRANSGYSAIEIGIGIHYGAVIIGTVGSDDRMDTTVIGDSVNIASRLETLAPTYFTDIVVSEQLLATAQQPCTISRILDWVKVKGRRTPLRIFEVFNHLTEEQQELKMAIAGHIEVCIQARIEQRWEDALEALAEARTISPDDPLIEHHQSVCEGFKHQHLAADWDGAVTL
jgi:adenylate cyclase